MRGAGPRGLAGIPAIRGRIIRPLLDLSRAEVECYLEHEGLRYRSDRSNADVAHTRNRIRHQLMPALRRLQPAITSHLSRLTAIMRAEDEFMSEQAEAAFASVASCRSNKSGERQTTLRLDAFIALPPALQRRVLRLAIANIKGDELDLELERVEALVSLALSGRTGAVVELPGGIYAQRGYEELVIRRASGKESEVVSNLESRISSNQEWHLPIPGELCIPELDLRITARRSRSKTVPSDRAIALMDAEAVPGPLLIRARRPGDRFHPIGAKSAVKLQDFLVNAKVPRAERDRVPVVLSGGRIVWLVGHRISNDAKVTAGTRRTVRLEARKLS
jgi:tRNA(Ile)-lysidine synthase